jgi:predicted transposase/invertase (TIGR01784 family)
MLYHWAWLYGSQLVKGAEYSALRRCACIFLLGYDELPSDRFHSTFKVLELHDHAPLTDQLELHAVQLRSLPSESSAEGREERPLVGWGRFFVAKDEREREELAMNDPVLQKAKQKLDELSADPEVQRIARDREEGYLLYQFELGVVREEGREEGRGKGREEGQRAMLRDLVQDRFPGAALEGTLPLEDASSEQLTKWARQLLTAGSFEEWLKAIGR